MKTFIYLSHSIFYPTSELALLTALPLNAENKLTFEPGQYLKAILQNGDSLLLSIANAPQNEGALVFHLRHNIHHPLAQMWLSEIKKTGQLRLEGPYGHCTLERMTDQKTIVFLAGGTGFAPVRALLEALSHRVLKHVNIKLFWGISRPEDVYDDLFLENMKAKIPHFESHLVLSNVIDFPSWQGPFGWVHEYCATHTQQWEKTLVYASGPPAMIQAAFQTFCQEGLSADKFVSDIITRDHVASSNSQS